MTSGHQALADHLAVAEDGVAVGDAEDLVELVGDEEDGLALGLELRDELVELGDLLVGEGGGGLVHDHDAGVDREGAGDGDEVLVGDAEVAEADAGVDGGADAGEHGAGVGGEPGPVDQAEAGAGGVAEVDVLGDGEVVEEDGLLVDRGDAGVGGGVGRREAGRRAVEGEGAGVGLVDAGQDLDEGRLAGAVLADEGGHLARVEAEGDAVEGADAGEGLRDAVEGQDRDGGGLSGGVALGSGRDQGGASSGEGPRPLAHGGQGGGQLDPRRTRATGVKSLIGRDFLSRVNLLERRQTVAQKIDLNCSMFDLS